MKSNLQIAKSLIGKKEKELPLSECLKICEMLYVDERQEARQYTFDIYCGEGTPLANPYLPGESQHFQLAIEAYSSWFATNIAVINEYAPDLVPIKSLNGNVMALDHVAYSFIYKPHITVADSFHTVGVYEIDQMFESLLLTYLKYGKLRLFDHTDYEPSHCQILLEYVYANIRSRFKYNGKNLLKIKREEQTRRVSS